MLGPQFLIIGAARSGTTALYEYLTEHPGLFLTDPKEPHYYAFAGARPAFTGPGDRETINRLAVTDRAAYRELYRGARRDQLRGEASVSTLYYPAAVARLRDEVPDAKLICVLRDPADRAFSAYTFMRTRGWEPCESFEQALADEARRVDAGWHHIWHYTGMSRYGQQMRHVLDVYPRDQVLALRHEDLVADPDGILTRVYAFLGVPGVERTVQPDPHRSGEPRNKFISRVVTRHHPVKSLLRPFLPVRLQRRLRQQIVARNVVRSQYRDETRAELVETFRPDVELTEQLTGLDLSAWRDPARPRPRL
jgi:hypothetical protein